MCTRSYRWWTLGTLLWRRVRAGELGQGSEQCGGQACLTGLWPPAVPPLSPGPRRKVLYQRAPRNIHRHVVLSEIKEAVAALPPVRSRLTAGSVPPAALPPGHGSCRAP